eukprot:10091510-Alexandrium_andersonii.AAC.1
MKGQGWAADPHAPPTEVVITDIEYVDDTAIPLWDESPATLLDKLRVVAETVHRVMSQHGLLLNFKPGKTAAVVALRGRGSRALNR